jgi:predicted nucleic acid-binding protein
VGITRYLADKSALARLHLPAVREELEPLIARALVGICGVTELEMLFSARNIQERSRMKEQLAASLDHIDTPEDIWDQAAEIQEALTEQAQHRSASIPDLLVAATARARGLEILHYDRDFDTIARYTEQPSRWVVPPGTVLSPPCAAPQRCAAQPRNVQAQAVEMQPALPVAFLILIAELLVAPELVVGLGKLAEFKRTPGTRGSPLEPIDVAPEEEAEQPGLRLGDRFSCHPDLPEVNRTYILTIRRWSDKASDCGPRGRELIFGELLCWGVFGGLRVRPSADRPQGNRRHGQPARPRSGSQTARGAYWRPNSPRCRPADLRSAGAAE